MPEWRPLQQDFSVYKRFDFDFLAVAIKCLYYNPSEVKKLDEEAALCEMFRIAGEKDEPFYIDKNNESCMGKVPLGWAGGAPAYAHSG